MAQSDFGTMNPATTSGTDLASTLSDFRDALNSCHKGNSAPSYIAAGMMWINDTATPWVINFYDGTDSIPIGTLNATTNVFSISSTAQELIDTTGSADTYLATLAPAPTAYSAGLTVRCQFNIANTGASTINVNSLGVKDIKRQDGSALISGDLVTSGVYILVYDGTNFVLVTSNAINVVEDTTPQLGGPLDTNDFSINESEGTAVASATSPNIWVTDGSTLHLTGSTTITDFADAPRVGAWRKIIFDGSLTFTHGSGITLPGSANITTAAGDFAFVYADAIDAFHVIYFRADGTAIISDSGISTYYRVTDSTDVTIATTEGGANAIGSSFTMEIPTEGLIRGVRSDVTIAAVTNINNPEFGLKISSTVYPFISEYNNVESPSPVLGFIRDHQTAAGVTERSRGTVGSEAESADIAYMIATDSLPTGSQTVTLVIWEKDGDSGGTVKGTTNTTDIILEVIDTSGI